MWWDGQAWGSAWPGPGAPPLPLDFVTTTDVATAQATVTHRLGLTGAGITTNQPGSLTGAVLVRPDINAVAIVILFLLCIIPGLIYLIASLASSRQQTFPFSVQFFPVDGGTRVLTSGSGPGLGAASTAALCLPTVDRPNGWTFA